MGDHVFTTDRLAIATRVSHLTQLVQGKSLLRFSHQSLVSQDGLLDALIVLYDECKNESLRRNKDVQTFVEKAQEITKELAKLRLSIHDFDVKKVIGRGHFGEVQLVREKRTDNVYAMKTLRKCDTLSQQHVSFYEEERDIMAKATSPWLTKLEYAFQDDRNLYLCMEFHAGGDLLALLARYDDVFEESMARFYLAELTLAIHALHSMGYLHQDIKPENCLLDRTGHLKLADFGSAAKMNQTHTTAFKMPIGTPDYVCPELLCALNEGNGRAYSEEVDWWSLGIVAYEFLFGVTPFTDPDGLVATTYSNIMNHQTTLEFPEDIGVSRSATQFIKELLTSSDKRLGYSGIFKHNFFSNMDFSRIRETKPPYIPTLKNASDTSNFDDFEPMKAQPHLQTYSNEFSGRNLPFIGFTYTKRLTSERTSIVSVDTPQGQNRLERKLTIRTKELQDVKGQVHALQSEDSLVKRRLTALEQALKDKEDIIVRVEDERDSHEKDISEYLTQITSLKRCLELEREARKESNRKAHDSIQEIKSAMKRAQQLQEGYKNDQLDQHKEFIAELEDQRLDLTQKNRRLAKELNFSKEEVRELSERLRLFEREVNSVKEESKTSICEISLDLKRRQTEFSVMENTYKERFVNIEVQNDDLLRQIEDLEMENGRLRGTVEKFESEVDQKSDFMEKYQENEQKRKSLEIRLHELQQIQGVEQRLTEQLHVKGKRITELSEALTDRDEEIMKLEHQLRKLERHASRINVDHQDQIRTLELRILDLGKKRVDSEMLTKLRTELDDKDAEIGELLGNAALVQESLDAAERRIDQLERMNRDREHDSIRLTADQESLEYELNETSKEKDRLRAKIKRLEKDLSEAKNKDSEDRNKYLDLRIETRQLKVDHENALSELKAELGQKTNAFTDAQGTISSLEQRNASLRMTVEEVRTALAESSHTYEQKILELEREILKLKSDLNSHTHEVNRVEEMRTDLRMAREQCGSIKQQNRDLATELERIKAQKTKLENEVKLANSELEKTAKKSNEYEKRCHELQQDTRLQKTDVNDRNARIRDYELKEKNWLKTKETLEQGIQEMEDEIDELSKRLCSESKSKQENQVSNKKLSEEAEYLREKLSENSAELDHLKMSEQRLSVDLDHLEKEHGKLEIDHKNVIRRLKHQEEDNFRLREETSQLITEIKSLKASSFTLTQNLENAMDKYDNLNAEKVELENQLETANINFEHDKFKLDSTVAQQTKLISFLQSKAETPVKKKKTIFGAKPKEPVPMAPCLKSLQHSLDVERTRNEDLKRQIAKLKGEIHQLKTMSLRGKGRSCAHCDNALSPSSSAAMNALVLSPSKQSTTSLISNTRADVQLTPLARPSKERMHHNIPHRFHNGVNTRATKCAVCLGTIQFVRPAAKCQECHVVCHPKCVQSLPASCGLPTQYMQHFAQVMSKKVNSPARVLSVSDIRGLDLNGWMKLPRGGKQAVSGWEKKWVTLDDDRLCIYDKDENDPRPWNTFCLFPKDAQVSVCSAVHASELPQTAATDLPYILKLESEPKSGMLPGSLLYLMALSFNEKQKWVASLEVLLADDNDEGVDSHHSVHGHTLVSFGLDMNCCLEIEDDFLLLGCEEGLFVTRTTDKYPRPWKLDGIPAVYQLQRLGDKLLLIAHNQDRELLWLDFRTVRNRIDQASSSGKASILAKSIQPQKIISVTLFQSGIVDGTECICLATTEKMIVLKYNQGLQNFGVRKEMVTSDPCSCMILNEATVVIGTNKVYSITLDHYVMGELLDKDDKSLAFAVFGASSYESYPLSIHSIDANQYLICFHEFGVFVDRHGRRARRFDLKWSGLPLSFAYHEPYLYVTYFNSVQVVNVRSENCCSREEQSTLEIPSPRFLGLEPKTGGIYLSSNRGSTYQLISIRGNLQSSNRSGTDNAGKENLNIAKTAAKRRSGSGNGRRLSFGNKRIMTTSQSTLNSLEEVDSNSVSTGYSTDGTPPKRSRTTNTRR